MKYEYGLWPESNYQSEKIDWKKAEKITAGLDIGTTSSQAVVMCDGELFAYANIRTGADFKLAPKNVLNMALGSSGMTIESISGVAATGFGRKNADCAATKLDDVQCHGKGARYIFGKDVKTVADLGGQTVKAMRLYGWDRVADFKLSDKCAAGFGRSIETMCNIFHVPITEIGLKSLDVEKDPEPSSTTCYNFANPEAVGLMRPGYKDSDLNDNEVLASYLFTIAWRALSTIGKLAPLDIGDIKLEEKVGFTGGLAKNPGITKRIERELNITALEPNYDPILAGAIGAALLV
ncbi:MAG: acyl-CoA dehydratase activase [Oscillospiraceae bacterium]|jgi:benzoyl-CoA reductase subunit A|nr:acyl-CoA dehydratase activase [Oscillospiraceae bacterium]